MVSVSVVIPCYNYGRYLPDAIYSLLGGQTSLGRTAGQTFRDFEIIVVDDGSQDNTQAILRRFEVTRLVHMRNAGTAAALNTGIAAASGKYIYILSADDMVREWGIERLYRAARAHHSLVYGDLDLFSNGRIIQTWTLTSYDPAKVIRKNPIPAAGVLYPKELWSDIGGYPETMRHGREGWAFNVGWSSAGWDAHHIGDSGYLYRWEGQNRSSRTATKTGTVEPETGLPWKEYYLQQMEMLYPDLDFRS